MSGLSIEFIVSEWQAWYSGISKLADWQSWRDGEKKPDGDALADVSFLPAMQRRRLGPLSKAVFNTAYPLLSKRDIPMLCCSVHGEAKRTYSLLQGVATDEDLSPTAFGLSVHNAVIGQLSIAAKVRSPTLALAGGDYPLQAGFTEAAGILHEGVKELLLLFCEEPLPELYNSSAKSPSGICATALLLKQPDEESSGTKVALVPSIGAEVQSAFMSPDYQLPIVSALLDKSGTISVAPGWELLIHAN
ncbi:beta-ketoacyl synthase chain length factor [Microbulbifer sp. GL-2]|uniref:beta-ketoacyl synthase chain length factor n=1 Tax=Microbulbifer sp. GL-2 TaxID=2591606 RepID=UPI0011635127|nr:beta-ketoacyl synthase chain length factor [Microbulbifer sp. GL-2]BBM01215.1 hypothetical protein GL2_12890 [Microbulbifer sp. GL-2]